MAERVLAIAPAGGAVRAVRFPDMPDVTDLDLDLAGLEGGGVYRVVHVGSTLEPDEAVAAFEQVASYLAVPYPAMVVQQWLVSAAGRRLTEDAVAMLRALHDAALESEIALGGTIIACQSSDDSVAHTREEEIGFGADVSYCLAATDLSSSLDPGNIWAAGASSLFYDAKGSRDAAGALVLGRFVRDRLLADVRGDDPQDPAREQGREWLRDQGLQVAAEAEQLLASGDGSVVAAIWAEVPELPLSEVSYWPDRLASWFDFVVQKRLPKAREQIQQNAGARLQQAKDAATRKLLGDLQEVPVIDRARLFALGMVDLLDEMEEALGGPRRPPVEGPVVDEWQRELEVAIMRLPYVQAVLLHAFVLGVMTAAFGAMLVVSGGFPALLAGVVGFFVAAGWGVGKYLRRLLRLQRARNGTLDRMRADLEADLVEYTRAQQLWLLSSLRNWLTAPSSESGEPGVVPSLVKLALDGEAVASLCEGQSAHRESAELHSTRYALTVPSSLAISTEQLAARTAVPHGRELDELLGSALFEDCWSISQEEIIERGFAALEPLLSQGLWPDLTALLDSSAATRSAAAELLRTSVAPMLAGVEAGVGLEPTHQTFTPTDADVTSLDHDDREILTFLDEAGLQLLPATTSPAGSRDLLVSVDTVLLGTASSGLGGDQGLGQ